MSEHSYSYVPPTASARCIALQCVVAVIAHSTRGERSLQGVAHE